GKLASPTNWHTVISGPLAEDSAVVSDLYREMAALGARHIDLAFLGDSDMGAALRELDAAGYRTDRRVIQRSPYLSVSGEWEPFWTSRSRNLRGAIRRCRNRLADL